MRFGIIGGTFDPVHLGHLICAETARNELSLDKILFMPAALSPHKLNAKISNVQHRIAMLSLALEDNPYFDMCLDDIERGGTSFTVDTLAELHKKLNEDDKIFLIVGADNFLNFTSWKDWQIILSYCRLAVFTRPGYDQVNNEMIVNFNDSRITLIKMPLIDISATEIRLLAYNQLSLKYRVLPSVEKYIQAHNLYT